MSLFFRNNKQTVKSATSTTPYVLTLDDNVYIAYPGQTVTLPDPATSISHTFTIKLGATHGGSGDNVTINVANGGTIEGSSTKTITTDWGFHKFVSAKNSAGTAQWLVII